MERLQMSEKNIEELPLYYGKKTNEATLYEYSKTEILKKFNYPSDNKITTLYEIEKQKRDLESVEELLIFKKIVVEYFNVLGVLMDVGYKMNLKDYLRIENISYNDSIILLKQIGKLLDKLEHIRKEEHKLNDFFIGDLHESNILVDPETKKIQICDLDSCKIGMNKPFETKYLQFFKTYSFIKQNLRHKYPANYYCTIPNRNTDLYCYMVMILKILFSFDITNLSVEEFYKNLYSLKKQGLPDSLYIIFYNLYTPIDNQNPYALLDDIPLIFEHRLKNMV